MTDRRTLKFFTRRELDRIPQLARMSPQVRTEMKAVSYVLPFRVNQYVLDELIDWDRTPDDPMYQLTFPQPEMLDASDLNRMVDLVRQDAPASEILAESRRIQSVLNPHPGGQVSLNVPMHRGVPLRGVQHKYRETVLFFPSQGQTCHAYCSYCFRWAQFVGDKELRFASKESETLVEYLHDHPEVSSVLITGGDPMVMRAKVLERYIQPILDAKLEHLKSIRIGTKAPAFWPHRFTQDQDADELLRLLSRIIESGLHLAVMAHYSNPVELLPRVAREAVQRIQSTGAVIRSQAPLIRRINDNAETWQQLWRTQVGLGIVPYYMFVERDTGPKQYFEVPLARALSIFQDAYRSLPGLARSVRGPVMSTTDGKFLVDGIAEVGGERMFVLKVLQARDPSLVGQILFAPYSEDATWITDLDTNSY